MPWEQSYDLWSLIIVRNDDDNNNIIIIIIILLKIFYQQISKFMQPAYSTANRGGLHNLQ